MYLTIQCGLSHYPIGAIRTLPRKLNFLLSEADDAQAKGLLPFEALYIG